VASAPGPEARRVPPAKPQRSGTVGDIVPILPAAEIGLTPDAEPAAPAKKSPPPAKREPEKKVTQAWQEGPPPMRKPAEPKAGVTARRKEKVEPPPDESADPTAAIQAASWDAPPPV